MTFDESVTRLRDSMFVNLYGKIDDHVYHKLDRLVRLIKKHIKTRWMSNT